MAYRFTNTDKWGDAWFSNLKPNEKLLFMYLYENCDIAGFIELNIKRWAVDIGHNNATIEGALEGLRRGLTYSDTEDCIYIRTFLKHQKNLPLTPEKNPAHRGIMKRFESYKTKFLINDVYQFIEGALEGLHRPLGNGKDIGNDNSKDKSKKPEIILPWDDDRFCQVWEFWKQYKREEHNFGYKSEISEQAALSKLVTLSNDKIEIAMMIIKQSIEEGWKGLFELKGKYAQTEDYDIDDIAQNIRV